MSRTFVPARVPPPGRILSRELEARGWTQKDLAEIIGRPEQTISAIVNAKKRITTETARELAEAFGTSAELWANLESAYQLHQARQKDVDRAIRRKARLYELAPITDLIQRGWIEGSDDLDELERQVCAFYAIPSPDETPAVFANLRHSGHRGPDAGALAAWVTRVGNRVRGEQKTPFRHSDALADLPQLLALSDRVEGVAEVPTWLRRYGIHFLVEPHLPRSYLDGAAFFVDEQPVIALTLRYDRVDNFWFALLHELAHLLLGHEGVFLDDLKQTASDDAEREANLQASSWLFPEGSFDTFVQRDCFTKACVVAFAQQQKRHPGLVVGRLQWERRVSYNTLRTLLEPVSSYVSKVIPIPG